MSERPDVSSTLYSPHLCALSSQSPKIRGNPWYHIKLTLWYIGEDRLTPNNSMYIKRIFYTAANANSGAFQLAQSCQADGENVMLAERKTFSDDNLNEYAIGWWDHAKVDIPMDSWEWQLHRPNAYFKRNCIEKVSGMFQVVREDPEHGFQIGSPLVGVSRRGSMHWLDILGLHRMRDGESWD